MTTLGTIQTARAQSAPVNSPRIPAYDSGDAVLEARPPPLPSAPPPRAPPVVVSQPEEPLFLPGGETLYVRDFEIENAEFVSESELRAVLEPYRGRNLTMAQIQEAASSVTAAYRSRGYLVARAYLPRQDARAGILRIRVLLGRYGAFAIENRSLVAGGLIRDAFAGLAGSLSPVSLAGLERSMLLVSDMPGAKLPTLTISPGQTPGTSDFVVDVQPGPIGRAYFTGDNYGSPFTGTYRLSGGLELNSPLGVGDKLGVNVLGTEGGGLLNARLTYGAPVVGTGLRAEAAAAVTRYELGGTYQGLQATGSADSFEGTLSLPIVRRRLRSVYLGFTVTYRHFTDSIAAVSSSTVKTTVASTLMARYESWENVLGRMVPLSVTAAVVDGDLVFSDVAQEAFNVAGADTAGGYVYTRVGASSEVELLRGLGLSLMAGAQKSLGKNLDASEQMLLNGPSGVRAYRTIVSGDNGYLVSAEMHYALWVPSVFGTKLTHSLGLFFDVGGEHLEHDAYSDFKGAQLQDAGGGYTARYGSTFGSVQWACALGARPPSTQIESPELVLVQIGAHI